MNELPPEVVLLFTYTTNLPVPLTLESFTVTVYGVVRLNDPLVPVSVDAVDVELVAPTEKRAPVSVTAPLAKAGVPPVLMYIGSEALPGIDLYAAV